ncbi:MAG TPA: hypothetical protein VIT45_12150 [Allosphingosinicella sp.]
MTTIRHWTRAGAALLTSVLLASASGASAQTCRTSLSTGMTLCDNGATARTSPVAGTTTFSDGRTARTDPATGTTRFSDGTSYRTVPVEIVSAPVPPAIHAPTKALEQAEGAPAARKPSRPAKRKPVRARR